MATTVEPTIRERTTVAATGTPWYRDRNRQLAAIAGAVGVAALIALVPGDQRPPQGGVRGPEPQPGARGGGGGEPAAGLERAPEADPDLQGHRRGQRGRDHAEPGPDGERPERAGRRSACGTSWPPSPTAKYAAPAYGLLGAALENAKKWADAGDAFTNASKAADARVPQGALPGGCRPRLPRGRQDRRRPSAAYREIIQKYPKTSSFTEAQVRLAELTDGKM